MKHFLNSERINLNYRARLNSNILSEKKGKIDIMLYQSKDNSCIFYGILRA